MFTSNNNVDTFEYSSNDQSILLHQKPSYLNVKELSLLELEEYPPLPFFQFPSPFELDHQNNELYFLGHQQNDPLLLPFGVDHDHQSESIIDKMPDLTKTDTKTSQDKRKKSNTIITENQNMLRKRSPRRDRHSKISTAHGLRDRRMRLSLDVAREFFWLQDMLGYDKASKTVEWLILQSKSEILKIEKALGHSQMKNYDARISSSTTTTTTTTTTKCQVISREGYDDSRENKKSKQEVKNTRDLRKAARHNAMAKDLRQKARARARERTIEKIWSRSKFDEAKNQLDQISQVSSCSPIDQNGEELSAGTHSQNMNMPIVDGAGAISSSSEKLEQAEMINIGNWSPYSTIHDYFHNPEVISQEIQFSHYQIMDRPIWEAYNYQNLC
ncbi:hypothetical protein ACFE04_006715 [Oxalis oulophora]